MATLVQQEGSQGYLQAQQEVFNQSENENFNFSGFLEQVNFLEQNKVEMIANRMMFRNDKSEQVDEKSEQGGNLDNNEWSYQIQVNDSFNTGNQDHSYNQGDISYHEYSGYSHDLSVGYNQENNEYNIETGGYNTDNRDPACYNYDTGYNGGGSGYNNESHGLYESDTDIWNSPQTKFNRRQSQGFQTLQDLINTSKAEDIPFSDEDFPSLGGKDVAESRPPREEKNWAVGWTNQKNVNDQNSNQVQLGTNPGQIEPQISFQWLENGLANVLSNAVVEPIPIMNQANSEGRPVPNFNQFEENLKDSDQFQLPLFTPPEPSFFSQSVANWNSREIMATI